MESASAEPKMKRNPEDMQRHRNQEPEGPNLSILLLSRVRRSKRAYLLVPSARFIVLKRLIHLQRFLDEIIDHLHVRLVLLHIAERTLTKSLDLVADVLAISKVHSAGCKMMLCVDKMIRGR